MLESRLATMGHIASARKSACARLALSAAAICAALLAGCAAEPPQFRSNLVDMKVQGVNPKPEVEVTPPDAAPKIAGSDLALVVEQTYGLRLAKDSSQAVVESVVADKPAADAAILAGDVITKIVVVEKSADKDAKPQETAYPIHSRDEAIRVLLEKVIWGKGFKVSLFRNQEQQIADILLALFGTPDQPNPAALDPKQDKKDKTSTSLVESFGFDLDKLEVSAGAVREHNQRQYGLYRLHCAHCHGITGDGAGPTASFLNPYPRDYRQGKFKFKSTAKADKPTRADLLRVLTEGIPGTAMPSFRVLPESQREALVEYVQYLSVRGQTEIKLIQVAAEGRALPAPAALIANLPDAEGEAPDATEDNIVSGVLQGWRTAAKHVVAPIEPPPEFVKWITRAPKNLQGSTPPPPLSADDEARRLASLKRGRELFYVSCVKCHGNSQLGDGPTKDYDDWFKWRKDLEGKPAAEQTAAIAEYIHLGALPPRFIQPRNLRSGVYRGGRRPLDIYRRIFVGIEGTPMPEIGAVKSGEEMKPDSAKDSATDASKSTAPDPTQAAAPEAAKPTDKDVWDIVHYVLSLPYEPLSQPPADSVAALHPAAQPTATDNQPDHKQPDH